jgi:hypothetical protein
VGDAACVAVAGAIDASDAKKWSGLEPSADAGSVRHVEIHMCAVYRIASRGRTCRGVPFDSYTIDRPYTIELASNVCRLSRRGS